VACNQPVTGVLVDGRYGFSTSTMPETGRNLSFVVVWSFPLQAGQIQATARTPSGDTAPVAFS
jgi:hypothetical protein